LAQAANATHPRPKGASPMSLSLVPAYKMCTIGNTTHGAPLSYSSCTPPDPESDYLTVGTPDANGAGVGMVGTAEFQVDTVPPQDILINVQFTDVRCQPATNAAVCGSANAADGPDYSGQFQWVMPQRASDHYNGPGLNEAATVVDLPGYFLGVDNGSCAATADTSIGATCSSVTSQNAIVPGAIQDNMRLVLELNQFHLYDGGPDGEVATADNTLFIRQGLFVP
jgi:hypothetical protein